MQTRRHEHIESNLLQTAIHVVVVRALADSLKLNKERMWEDIMYPGLMHMVAPKWNESVEISIRCTIGIFL